MFALRRRLDLVVIRRVDVVNDVIEVSIELLEHDPLVFDAFLPTLPEVNC